MNLFCLGAMALLTSLIGLGSFAYAAPMTLRQAATYAIAHSPTFNSAQREALISSLERKSAGAAFLPSLDLTTNIGMARTYPSTSNSPWTSGLSLDLTETLYDNGQNITRYRTAKLREEENQISLLQARDRLLLEVAIEFYNHGEAVKSLEIRREQHRVLRRQYQLVEAAYRQGLKTRKDYLRFKTELSRADIDLVNAVDTVSRSRESLKRLLGVPLGSDEQPDFVVDESKPQQQKPLDIPIESHRDYRIATIQARSDSLQEAQIRRRLWPELSLTGGATYGSSDFIGTGNSISQRDSLGWRALITVKYNFLDWGTRSRDISIASERTYIQANARADQLIRLRQEIDRLTTDFLQLRENFRLGEELLELENRNFELLSLEYRQGKVQYLDYITSLRELSAAKAGYYSSLFSLKKGILSQRFHQGTIYETIINN